MIASLESTLIKEGLITEKQASEIVSRHKKEGKKFLEAVIDVGYAKEEEVALVLSKKLSIPYIKGGSGKLKPIPDECLENIITYEFALKNCVLPLCRTIDCLTVAAFDPTDFETASDLERTVGSHIKFMVATRSDLKKAIKDFYAKH